MHARGLRNTKGGRRIRRLLALAVGAALTRHARADTDNWLDNGYSSWSNSAAWSSGHAPAANDTVTIVNPTGTLVNYDYTGATNAASLANFTLGGGGAGIDYFNSPGIPTVTFSATNLTVAGSGVFTQKIGTFAVSHLFTIGAGTSGAAASYAMYDGKLNVTATEQLGATLGVFNQFGGTHTVGGGGSDGLFIYAGGTYNLSAGTLNGFGEKLAGVFNQTGGAHRLPNDLTIDAQPGTNAYNLSAGTIVAGTNTSLLSGFVAETIGNVGVGNFVQTGGSNTVNFNLVLGNGTGSTGNYTLSAGSLLVSGTAVIGGSGTANFSHTGGTVNATSVVIASGSNSTATYTLGGSATLIAPRFIVGDAGYGSFVMNGGTAQLSGGLTLGNQSTGVGAGLLTAGILTVSNANALIGNSGRATFLQTGGTHFAPALYLGYGAGSSGTYRLTAGQLIIGSEKVGFGGAGTFVQDGGTNSASDLTVRGGGSYAFNAGRVSVTGAFTVGSGGLGSFTQTAGTLSTGSSLIGGQGAGNFVQSGGTHSTNTFTLSTAGTYTLAGTAVLTVGGQETIGAGGVVNQNGGSNTTPLALTLGTTAGSGTYNLNDGTLNVGTVYVGDNGGTTGTFNQAGGTVTARSLNVASSFGRGAFVQSGGNANFSSSATVGGAGTVTLSGGSLTLSFVQFYGHLNVTGGVANVYSLSGSGTGVLSVGGGLGTARAVIKSLFATVVNVATNGTVAFLPTLTSAPNFISGGLTLSGNGTLDLANTNLITSGSTNAIRQYLTQGYDHGAWDGPAGGIVSSTAATAGATLGYAVPGDSVGAGVSTQGRTLIAYTLPGDADLNGTVNFLDFLALQNHFAAPGDWTQGDFNYDGVVDSDDFALLQDNFGDSIGAPRAGATPQLSVPEPGSLAFAALLAGAIRRWRRTLRR